ncbi:MAG: YfjI family protein [Planctomycetales bacterium]|nr:YfjI family protein [Planctomycetales bacterium]
MSAIERALRANRELSRPTSAPSFDHNQSNVSNVIDIDEAWPALIPIAGPEPEPMQSDDFPPCVGKIVQAVVEHAEVPVELPALMALGVLATASQKKYEIACDGSHKEPLNLFVCPALDPGNRKTSVVSILTAPLRRWERDQRAELAPAIREAESHRLTALKRIEVIRAKAAKSNDGDERDGLQKEIDDIERDLPHVQTMPLLTTDDCTPEHIATLLSHHGERLAIVSDEGGIFDIVAGRYSRGVPNLDVFLQAHAGSPVRVHRGSRDPVDLQSPCLTVAVSCQPYVLDEMGSNKAFRGRGLLARFLFAVPKSNLGFRTLQPSEIPSAQLDAWNHVVRTMLDREQHVDDYGNAKSQILYLAPEAYRLWKSEQHANEIDMRPGGSWAENTGWASKYPGAVLRIAGVLHCAVCTSVGQDPATVDVAESTMRFAVQLGRKIKSHSRQAFGMMQLTNDQKNANKILDWIQRDGITEFTGRECSIHCNSAGSVKELDGAFDLLITHGWIRTGQKKQPDGGGRPSQPFKVNPAVAQFDDKTDKTQQRGVTSVMSSELAKPFPRPESPISCAVDDFEFQFGTGRL